MIEKTSTAITWLARTAYERYGAGLHRYLLKRLGRLDLVSDVSQGVYECLLRTNDPELVRNPRAYLYGIASRLVYDAHARDTKTEDREIALEDLSERELHTNAGLQEDDSSERLNLQLQLDRALEQLPTMHKLVLLCTKRDGMSYAEAAQELNIPETRVVRYVGEACARMKMLAWDR